MTVLPDCGHRNCQHPADLHTDRAVTACHGKHRCPCTGYTIRQPRITWPPAWWRR